MTSNPVTGLGVKSRSQSAPTNSSATSASTSGSSPTLPHLPPVTSNSLISPPSTSVSCSPLVIGKSFIKQYYHVLTTTPEHIHRFYKPGSVWSHSFEPNVPTEPRTMSMISSCSSGPAPFFQWAGTSSSEDMPVSMGLRLDFGRGAIDAQETIQGGILLVVTGHMSLPQPLNDKDEHEMKQKERLFVHTFFLNNGASSGKKRQFYVHNDILRFLTSESRISSYERPYDLTHPPPKPQVKLGAITTSSPPAPSVSTVTVGMKEPSFTKTTKEQADHNVLTHRLSKVLNACKVENTGPSPSPKMAKITTTDVPPPQDIPIPEPQNSNSASSICTKEDDIPGTVTITTKPTEDVTKKDKTQYKSNKSRVTRANRRDSVRDRDRHIQGKHKSCSSSSNEKDPDADVPSSRDTIVKKGEMNKTKSDPHISSSFASKLPGSSWASLVAGGGGTLSNSSFVPTVSPVSTLNVNPSIAQENIEAFEQSIEGVVTECIDPIIIENWEHPGSLPMVLPPSEFVTPLKKHSFLDSKAGLSDHTPNLHMATTSIIRRTPEATLFLKNVCDRTKEHDIRSMFKPYADRSGQAILGITLHANRGFCFVDFDHREVVDAILDELVEHPPLLDGRLAPTTSTHAEGKFLLHGRILEVGRKVSMEKERTTRGGRFHSHRRQQRSSSPGNGGHSKHAHANTQLHRGSGGHRRNNVRGGGGNHHHRGRQQLGQGQMSRGSGVGMAINGRN